MATLPLGTPAPWFEARSPVNPRFQFSSLAGRFVLLSFVGSAADPLASQVLAEFQRRRAEFDDERLALIVVSTDPEDERSSRIVEQLPGTHLFWDFDRSLSRLFGAALSCEGEEAGGYQPCTYVLDERLRIAAVVRFGDNPQQHVSTTIEQVNQLSPLEPPRPALPQAPVLVVPRIFEPMLCRRLIEYYESRGGQDSGFMRDVDGKTTLVHDYSHKRRSDCDVADEGLRHACMVRIHDRLAPEIKKAFQFTATRIERYIVACYDSTTGGHFHAHRDNTTRGTAHRRFAVSLNLDSGEHHGGDLRFPEFGRATYRAPSGGAVVFSCSLLHEATPVTAGKRYAFLPFLYDEAAARVREENLKHLAAAAPPAPADA